MFVVPSVRNSGVNFIEGREFSLLPQSENQGPAFQREGDFRFSFVVPSARNSEASLIEGREFS
jgi:hypothetical protein